MLTSAVLALVWLAAIGRVAARSLQPPPTAGRGQAVERLGKDLFRVGHTRVNTATREVAVDGTVNPVTVLEFLANPPHGLKAYESALTLDTDGVTLNAALMLIGLERNATPVRPQTTLEGDRVELWVDLPGPPPRRIRGDRLIYDRQINEEVAEGAWTYTGSSFLEGGLYWADADGVLLGFVHSGPAIIERSEPIGLGRYGAIVLNPNLGLRPGMAVTLTIKALTAPRTPKPAR